MRLSAEGSGRRSAAGRPGRGAQSVCAAAFVAPQTRARPSASTLTGRGSFLIFLPVVESRTFADGVTGTGVIP
jgi:hypothetical protein